MLSFLALVAVTLWLFYKLWVSAYSYWESKGYAFIPGVFPYGSSKELVTLSKYQGFTIEEMYKKMAPHPFFGIYIMRKPILVLRDPEIIRLVLAKEFSHFRARQAFVRSSKEFLDQHLFNIEGEKWRALRLKVTPTFTSGKLKNMFPLFVHCAEALNNLLVSRMESVIDIKDITTSFTIDTICTCAFGLEIDALTNSNSKFRDLGVDIFTTRTSFKVKNAVINTIPLLSKIFVPRFMSEYMSKMLLDLVKKTVEYREKSGVKRNDFIDLLIQLNKKELVGDDLKDEVNDNYAKPIEMTYELMAAQCFGFFAAGYETSSAVQSHCFFEMAVNPDIQERLHEEIVTKIKAHGELSYKAIQEMDYLDAVVYETMRKYPTLPSLTRRCTKPFTMPSGHKVDVGDQIIIPVYALYHDPAYFPKPDIFDPDRFSSENKESIRPFTYMPFGEGPRICIGMRFGLLQTKMGLITVLRKYKVEKTDSTQVPLKLIGSSLVTATEGPVKLKLTRRNDPV